MRGLLAGLVLLLAAALPARADDRGDAQSLVDNSTLAVQEMLTTGDAAAIADMQRMLRRARAALVCPRIFRAGFILGGEGGGCVLVARDAAGSWSSPAFYGLASGSLGLQFGVQDMQVLMLVMSDAGADRADGQPVQARRRCLGRRRHHGRGARGLDHRGGRRRHVTFARARGLFAGLALEGSLLTNRSDWNRAYYGRMPRRGRWWWRCRRIIRAPTRCGRR